LVPLRLLLNVVPLSPKTALIRGLIMDRITKLIEAIRKLIEGEFTGYVKINFTQGSLGRIEKFEELDDATIITAAGEQT
jgi:hypothetical protein